MSKLIDLTGQRFGSLIVLKKDTESTSKNAKWICQCDCGKIVSKFGQGLRNGETTCCNRNTCPYKKNRYKDLTGQKFSRLLVLESTEERKNNSVVWKCKCDCGTICKVDASSLVQGRTKSCGCLKKETDKQPKGNVKDMIGQKFGHLTVIARDGSDKNGQAKWICECDCAQHSKITVLGSNLRRGHTQSCGCERRSHGELEVIKLLQDNNIPFETEKIMFKYSNGTNAKFDFYINNQYLIEYDGETHYQANLHGWHTQEQLQKQQERDAIKNEWCKENNIPLIRIPYTHLDDLCIEDLLLETSTFIVK